MEFSCARVLPAAGQIGHGLNWLQAALASWHGVVCGVSEDLSQHATCNASSSSTPSNWNLENLAVFPKDGHHVLDWNHEQSVVAFEVDRDALFGIEQDSVVLPDGVVLIVLHLGTDGDHPAREGVGISILSGRCIPLLVCLRSSSLRISTRDLIGSTVSTLMSLVLQP